MEEPKLDDRLSEKATEYYKTALVDNPTLTYSDVEEMFNESINQASRQIHNELGGNLSGLSINDIRNEVIIEMLKDEYKNDLMMASSNNKIVIPLDRIKDKVRYNHVEEISRSENNRNSLNNTDKNGDSSLFDFLNNSNLTKEELAEKINAINFDKYKDFSTKDKIILLNNFDYLTAENKQRHIDAIKAEIEDNVKDPGQKDFLNAVAESKITGKLPEVNMGGGAVNDENKGSILDVLAESLAKEFDISKEEVKEELSKKPEIFLAVSEYDTEYIIDDPVELIDESSVIYNYSPYRYINRNDGLEHLLSTHHELEEKQNELLVKSSQRDISESERDGYVNDLKNIIMAQKILQSFGDKMGFLQALKQVSMIDKTVKSMEDVRAQSVKAPGSPFEMEYYNYEFLLLKQYDNLLKTNGISQDLVEKYSEQRDELIQKMINQYNDKATHDCFKKALKRDYEKYDEPSLGRFKQKPSKYEQLESLSMDGRHIFEREKAIRERNPSLVEIAPIIEEIYRKDNRDVLGAGLNGCQDFINSFEQKLQYASPIIQEKYKKSPASLTEEEIKKVGYISVINKRILTRQDSLEVFSRIIGEKVTKLDMRSTDFREKYSEKFLSIVSKYLENEVDGLNGNKDSLFENLNSLSHMKIDKLVDGLIEVRDSLTSPKCIKDSEMVDFVNNAAIELSIQNYEASKYFETFEPVGEYAVLTQSDNSTYKDAGMNDRDNQQSNSDYVSKVPEPEGDDVAKPEQIMIEDDILSEEDTSLKKLSFFDRLKQSGKRLFDKFRSMIDMKKHDSIEEQKNEITSEYTNAYGNEAKNAFNESLRTEFRGNLATKQQDNNRSNTVGKSNDTIVNGDEYDTSGRI